MFFKNLLLALSLFVGLVLFSPALNLNLEQSDRFVLWDVGQGQWLTWVRAQACYHFDMGGERMDWLRLKQLCARKQNQVFFTHADSDHINLHYRAKRYLPHLCVQQKPLRKAYKIKLPSCLQAWPVEVQVWRPQVGGCEKSKCPKSNDLSMVFVLAGQVLVPGDSTTRMEKLWAPELVLSRVHTLVLGHHGSLTSTGDKLLGVLPSLRQAVVSARRQKYGHPHPVIEGRLHQKGVPLVSTHEWNHIWLQL